MPRAKAPKRPTAEDLVRDFDSQRNAASAHKKPRFDARNPSTLAQAQDDDDADEDTILELDEIGKGGQQAKRNAVRLEGYESDSSNENFNARANEKERAKKAAEKLERSKRRDSEDADMFAELEDDFQEDDDDNEAEDDDDDETVSNGKKGKEVRFMDEKDILGQVASSKAGGHVSSDLKNASGPFSSRAAQDASDDSENEVDDEERARLIDVDEELGAGAKKSHAPKLDAFNMKNEAEEGKFDETGNFVRNATDAFAVHDSWMEGTSKKDIKKAKEAHEKRERERRAKDLADDAISTSDVLATLIRRLDVGETILEALARYGAQGRAMPKWKQKKQNVKQVDEAEQQKIREAVESITAAADQLLSRGQEEVYDAERELLMRQYKRETGQDWVDERPTDEAGVSGDVAAARQWEYQWADARDGGEVHGPYDGATMASWNAAGYFGEGVQFRLAGTEAWRQTLPDFSE